MPDMENNKSKQAEVTANDSYIGNIWGWKFSWFGLALLLVLLTLIIYRHYALGVPIFIDPDATGSLPATDTLR